MTACRHGQAVHPDSVVLAMARSARSCRGVSGGRTKRVRAMSGGGGSWRSRAGEIIHRQKLVGHRMRRHQGVHAGTAGAVASGLMHGAVRAIRRVLFRTAGVGMIVLEMRCMMQYCRIVTGHFPRGGRCSRHPDCTREPVYRNGNTAPDGKKDDQQRSVHRFSMLDECVEPALRGLCRQPRYILNRRRAAAGS